MTTTWLPVVVPPREPTVRVPTLFKAPPLDTVRTLLFAVVEAAAEPTIMFWLLAFQVEPAPVTVAVLELVVVLAIALRPI